MGRVAWPQLLMGGRLFENMLVGKGVGLGRGFVRKSRKCQKNHQKVVDLGNDRFVLHVLLTPDLIK